MKSDSKLQIKIGETYLREDDKVITILDMHRSYNMYFGSDGTSYDECGNSWKHKLVKYLEDS